MFHPNVDESSGAVCLDVINQTWSPMYAQQLSCRFALSKQLLHRFDLVNVFEVFLPQLLLYPNPSDPLNGEAAALLMRDPGQYAARIRGTGLSRAALPCCLGLRVPGAEYTQKYAVAQAEAAADAADAAAPGDAFSSDSESMRCVCAHAGCSRPAWPPLNRPWCSPASLTTRL